MPVSTVHTRPADLPDSAPPRSSADETELVRAVLERDRKATAEFVDRYTQPVYRFIRRRVMPEAALAEDLVQETFLAAWRNLPSFRGDAPLQAWLLGIARHKVEDHYRKRLVAAPIPEDGDSDAIMLSVLPNLDASLDREKERRRIDRVLARLPESYRLVLLWRYMEQRSAREMAAETGRTAKSVERLLSRARARFREEWGHAR